MCIRDSSGCGDDEKAPDAQPTQITKKEICDVLSAEERADLVGRAVDEPAGEASDYPDFSCRWKSAEDDGVVVQLASAPVSEWLKTVPKVLDSVEKLSSLSAEDKKQIGEARTILGSGKVDDAEGCSIFTLLAEIGGFPKGSKTSVSYVDAGASPLVAAQHCDDGRFSSVAFTYRGDREKAGTAAAAAVLKVAQRLGA